MRVNQCFIVGRLGNNAEVRQVGDQSVTSFSVAVSAFKKDGKAEWFSCSWWGPRGAKLASYMEKGKAVWVQGEVGLREWKKQDGTVQAKLELRVSDVQLLSNGGDGQRAPATAQNRGRSEYDEFDDVPFG